MLQILAAHLIIRLFVVWVVRALTLRFYILEYGIESKTMEKKDRENERIQGYIPSLTHLLEENLVPV